MSDQAQLIIGIDEAGRGPLAGPVVAAAVILHPERRIYDLADSKALSAKKRALLRDAIHQDALFVGISTIEPRIIDEINILQATLLAMGEVLQQAIALHPQALVLIDGNQTVKARSHIPQRAIVKGDSTVESIMAASIVAKVHRDELMRKFDSVYPRYGFAQHKGYGTKEHRDAIKAYGPCPIHRLSFSPLKSENP